MLPAILAGGGAILGAKQAQDQKQANRQASDRDALMGSLQTAYGGFTGQGPGTIHAQAADPSVMGNALSGGVAGFSQGQAVDQAAGADAVRQAELANLGAKTATETAYGDMLRQKFGQHPAASKQASGYSFGLKYPGAGGV